MCNLCARLHNGGAKQCGRYFSKEELTHNAAPAAKEKVLQQDPEQLEEVAA